MSYFVGGNKDYAEDHGFALEPWLEVQFSNDQFYLQTDIGIVMGQYVFSSSTTQIRVDYSMGFVLGRQNGLQLVLHHSSLPDQTGGLAS